MKLSQAHPPQTNLQWGLGILTTLLFAAAGAYGSYVNTSISTTKADVVDLKIANANLNGRLDVIDSKLDLLLDAMGVDVTLRPSFHSHNQDKKQ